ncbi:AAA family ATPase [Actinoplanes sp. LDG1-06]|uniref:AAA family ATPase n=2 Tax=Paractinoplanes ovalisporus TaxID=2810368 RepID=A0ABS2AGP0_9ACTN|nr:AAA family ATPase [Actinoplanes ovalisporus]
MPGVPVPADRLPVPGIVAPAGRPPVPGIVGRVGELGALRRTVGSALSGGTGLALVEGEPGVGKTRLLEEVAAEAGRRGALVVWGRCLEGDGAPSMWPWVEAVGALLEAVPAESRAGWRAGELSRLFEPPAQAALPDRGVQFRMFERVAGLLAHLSGRRPVVLLLDDLQWADEASLHLVAHLAVRLPGGTAVVGALRDRAPAPGSELSRMLAVAGRVPGHRRVQLGPLSLDEVAALVQRETGAAPGAGAARRIHTRTAGNPFFVRELSRLLTGDGTLTEDAARQPGVPSAVRDVVRDRIAGLDPPARDLLQVAAIIGRDVSLALLARAAGLNAQAVLDLLEPLTALGLVGNRPGDPYAIRFTHDLVRESVAESTPRSVAARLHLSVADALESESPNPATALRSKPANPATALKSKPTNPATALENDAANPAPPPQDDPRSRADMVEGDVESLAHHLWAAGPLADPARTTRALVHAARRAATMAAFEAADRQLQSAVRLARSAGLEALELSALSLLAIVIRRMARYGGPAFAVLERAEDLARRLGRDAQAADFLYIRWIASAHAAQEHRDQLVHRLRDQGQASRDPLVRAYGHQAWGLHQWEQGDITESFRHMGRDNRALFDNTTRDGKNAHRHDDEDAHHRGREEARHSDGEDTHHHDREDAHGHDSENAHHRDHEDARHQDSEDGHHRDGEDAHRHDVQLPWPCLRAMVTALHGDVAAARAQLDAVEAGARDDPYMTSVWAYYTGIVASMAGDPQLGRRAVEGWQAADPERFFVHVDPYLRQTWCWTRALTGDDPARAAAEAEELLTTTLLDPPRWGLAFYCGLIAEMFLAAGDPASAAATLDRADAFLQSHGQRYAEGLLLLLRARTLAAAGEPKPLVRAAAERARSLSTARGAHLFADRATRFLESL